MPLEIRKVSFPTWLILLTLVVVFVACKKAEQPSYKVFVTPADAGSALIQAAKSGDENAILAIFGPESKPILSSGNAVEDKAAVDAFAGAYQVMHRWRRMPDGAEVLLIGADNFSFPISLRKTNSGQWFFDAAAGEEEILRRRIGRNELAIIEVSQAVV